MYNGPWNDNDSRWTDDFKKQAKMTVDKFDGFFYLPVEDYKKAFRNLVVVHYQDWQKQQVDLNGTDSSYSFMLDNTVEQSVSISVDSYTKRMVPSGCS